MGIGNPISPRVAAVSELILTVSTLASCYFDFMQPVAKELQKTQENGLANFKKPQRFCLSGPKLQNLYITTTSAGLFAIFMLS
jgi:hypothetical protein